MTSFVFACSACSVLMLLAGSAVAAASQSPSPKAGKTECAAMLRQAYACKVEIRHLAHSQAASTASGPPDDLAVREARCDEWQERYVAFCRK